MPASMKTIKVIENLSLDKNGVCSKTKNGRFQRIHFKQGDLDGACAVYSALMVLIGIGAVNYSEIVADSDRMDQRYSIEKLKKELMDMRGLHRRGNHFHHEVEDSLKKMLEKSFGRRIKVRHIDSNIQEEIRKGIEADLPILMSYSYSRGAHALVAIGVETDNQDTLTKILCLDPGYPTPKFTYWNSVIDLTPQNSKRRYTHRNIAENGTIVDVKLDDILLITKR